MIQVSALIGYIHAVIQYYYVTYVCVCVCVCVCTCVYMCVCFIIFSSKCSSFSTEIKQFIHGNHGRLSLHTSLLGKCGSSFFSLLHSSILCHPGCYQWYSSWYPSSLSTQLIALIEMSTLAAAGEKEPLS